jgi:hypothetical protein
MLIDARTLKSDAFFRFTVTAKADVLPAPANIQQWNHQPRTNCQTCNKDVQPTLAERLNGCVGNMTEMTKGHNKVVGNVPRATEEYTEERSRLKIEDNTIIRKEGLSEEVQRLRPDLNFDAGICASSDPALIDISCAYGRIYDGTNTLEKVYLDAKAKSSKLSQKKSNIQEIHLETIPMIVSSPPAGDAKSLEALRGLLLCDDKAMKKIEKRPSEAAIARSTVTWRNFARDMPHAEDRRVRGMTIPEVVIANDKQAHEIAEENQQGQESGSG